MPENSRPKIAPLDWQGLVEEALRRRRSEGLTQKEHAALAQVSTPTIIAFDRKKTSLSLGKAIDILHVVGLVAERSPANPQDIFVHEAEQRWVELTNDLGDDAPPRQPFGHQAYDYNLAGANTGSVRTLLDALRQADRKYTGWPPFWVPTREEIAPYPFDGGVECWLVQPTESEFNDAAHSDFWRATVDARLYLRRGYQEDSADVLTPATIFDLTLPVWRAGEVLMHAYHLAKALDAAPDAEATVRVHHTGLAGRTLKSWANPHRGIIGDYRCRTNDADGSVSCRASEIESSLPKLVTQLLAPVYERFDFYELPDQVVEEELDRLRNDRSRRSSRKEG